MEGVEEGRVVILMTGKFQKLERVKRERERERERELRERWNEQGERVCVRVRGRDSNRRK